MARDNYLITRGHQYYLRITIPRPIRHLFPSSTGKPRDHIVEPLGRNYDPARVECDRRVADYRALFSRAGLMTAEAVQNEIEAIKRHAEGRKTVADLPMLQSELERIRRDAADPTFRKKSMQKLMQESEARHRQARLDVAPIVAGIVKDSDITPGSAAWNDIADKVISAEALGMSDYRLAKFEQKYGPDFLRRPTVEGETITQASEAWLGELKRTGVRPMTLDGHRLRVRAFVEHCGDIPLGSINRKMAADFLSAIAAGRSNRTVNNYCQTMLALFKDARNRGRATGENPFEDQRRKVAAEKREAFTGEELQKIFAALPAETSPKRHTPESALPWAVRIAAFTGMRLEEIAQLTVADIQTRGANGGTVVIFDIHNGDGDHHLKNNSSARAIPVHSELVRAGLLKYIRALPKNGLLFPGLRRRASKGDKIGARLGELFRKLLIALGMKRDGLCFHSLRHSVAQRLEAAAVSQTDAARVLGHAIEGESYGTYSSGPGLKRLAATVEEIRYE
jgi:integrase